MLGVSKARNLVLFVISPDFDVFTERQLGMNEKDKRQVLSLGWGFASGTSGKAGDVREASVIPGSGRSSGGGRGSPLQCSCLENPMDRGAWQAAVHGVTKSQTQFRDETTTKEAQPGGGGAGAQSQVSLFSQLLHFPQI